MNVLNTTACLRLVLTFGHFIWQATLILLLAWVARRVMSRHSAASRYGLLVAALLLMVACPIGTAIRMAGDASLETWMDGPVPLDGPGGPPRLGWTETARPPTPVRTDVSAGGRKVTPVLIGGPSEMTSRATRQAGGFPWQAYAPRVTIAYLLGTAVMVLRLFVAVGGGRRLHRCSEPVEDETVTRSLVRQARALGLRAMPAVGLCRDVAVPVVVGVLRPMILLPVSLTTQLTREQIEMVLAHELGHIKRYDHLVNLVQCLTEAVLFFHPAVWVLSRWIRIEREHCCDDLALRGGTSPVAYAESLVRMAEVSAWQARPAVLALGADGQRSQLGLRISRLLGNSGRERLHLRRTWTLLIALVGANTLALKVLLSAAPAARANAPIVKADGTVAQDSAAGLRPPSVPSSLITMRASRGEILDRRHRVLAGSAVVHGSPARVYPMGKLAAQLIGYVDSDGTGRSGIELMCNATLKGGTGPGAAPNSDGNVVLTIDASVQEKLEEQLAKRVEFHNADSAVGLVMDVNTGEILAMASHPTFDPSQAGGVPAEIRKNRAIGDPVEAGSVFKPFVMSAVLANHVARREALINCYNGSFPVGERVLHDSHPFGALTVDRVLAYSSNIGMAVLGQRLGSAKIHAKLQEFGFGETTDIELPDEEPGIMLPLNRWTRDSMLYVCMGQEIAVTPIQLVAAFSAICNGGKLIRPRVLSATHRDHAAGQEPRQVLTPDVARDMVEMLTKVCTEGTGKACKLDHWQALGKTGTALLPRKDGQPRGYEPDAYLASFIGAAPASKPQVAVLVMVRHPRTNGQAGGQVSVPAVQEVLNYTLGYLNVPHDLPKQTRPGD